MNKLLIISTLLLLGINCFSQDPNDEVLYAMPNWSVGTSKSISQIDSTIIITNGAIFMATELRSNYSINVISKKDTVYEVLFKQIVFDDNVSVESEIMDAAPLERMMHDLVLEIQKEMSGLEYSFLVNQNTALAFEVKNEKELSEKVEEIIVVLLSQILDNSKIELDESEKNKVQLEVTQFMAEQMPAAIQTMLNAFNYIFQAHSFPFILDKTHIQDIDVYDVDQIEHGDKESKAKLVVNSSVKNGFLEIDYEYIYNKEEAYQLAVVAEGQGDEISIDEFDIDERVITKFDIETSWITSSLSLVSAKMGDITVNNKTFVMIQ